MKEDALSRFNKSHINAVIDIGFKWLYWYVHYHCVPFQGTHTLLGKCCDFGPVNENHERRVHPVHRDTYGQELNAGRHVDRHRVTVSP